jgi:CRISPR-associated protein Cmr2
MPDSHYLAVVISPVMATIDDARKTRELWAASFVFSRLMYHLLGALAPYGHIITPTYKGNETIGHKHGAGLWVDRCLVQLHNSTPPDLQPILNAAFTGLATDLGVAADILPQYFQVQFILADWSSTDMKVTAIDENDAFPIHRLNRLLDNLELRPAYRPQEESRLIDLLEANIHSLYAAADSIKEDKTIFLPVNDEKGTYRPPPRLPSIPEIALREFARATDGSHARIAYDAVVKSIIDANVIKLRNAEKGKRAKDLLDTQKGNEQFYLNLETAFAEVSKNERLELMRRHKYIAVVQLDGDGLGKAITKISANDPNGKKFEQISNGLMSFCTNAAGTIVDYGGLPIFAGGDDLLFLAPISMPGGSVNNVFSLCQKLDADFKRHLIGHEVSLSGGVSIFYYKYPLSEAVANAASLEKKAKKHKLHYSRHWIAELKKTEAAKLGEELGADTEVHKKAVAELNVPSLRKKNALKFEVRKHSGQTFGATISMQTTESFDRIVSLLEPDPDLEPATLTSVMHKLQAMNYLFAEAARGGRLAEFRKHNFNKGGRHDEGYLDAVMELSEAIFREYGDLMGKEPAATITTGPKQPALTTELASHHTNVLFAVLRLHQFLNQSDDE